MLKNMRHAACGLVSRAAQPVAAACSVQPRRLTNYRLRLRRADLRIFVTAGGAAIAAAFNAPLAGAF